MTYQTYLFCVVMYILGQALQLFWVKIPALKKRCTVANVEFAISAWWKEDWNIVIGNMIFGAILIFALNEVVQWKPIVLDYVKWFFAFMGAFGSSVAMTKWGNFEKMLNTIVDKKTNIADGKNS